MLLQRNHDAIWSEVNAPPPQFAVRPYTSQGLPSHPAYMVARQQFTPHASGYLPQYFVSIQIYSVELVHQ